MSKRNTRSGHSVRIIVLVSFVSALSLAASAAGQGAAAPAGIVGQVTDETGAALPGVTVTATGPALQVPQVVAVTDAQGDFRLVPLPIGAYTVVYELPGFATIRRENVRLTVGFIARLDQALAVGTLVESVTVSGASPVVDVSSTATRTELNHEELQVLPTTRDGLKALVGQVPGVRPTTLEVGMSGLGEAVVPRTYGQVGGTWYLIDGQLVTTPSGGNRGAHVDFNAIEAARVQTMSSNAEMPNRGIMVDTVLKSGGNNFHGSATFFRTGSALESNNVDDGLRAAGISAPPRLHQQTDASWNLGGRIVRDKVWFFVDATYKSTERDVLDAFHPDGTPVVLPTKQTFYVGKLSYQMTPGNRFSAFIHKSASSTTSGASRLVAAESRRTSDGAADVSNIQWQGLRGDSLVMSVQHGVWDFLNTYDGWAPGKVATTDVTTLRVTGDALDQGRANNEFRHHTKAVVSWHRSDFLRGTHEFKAGFDHIFSWLSDRRESRRSGNYQLRFDNGAPFQIATYNYPVEPRNDNRYIGVYAQDSWTIARRLTLNVGVRVARDNSYAPEQCRVAGDFAAAECWPTVQMTVFNSVAPRLHAALDLFGDGQTVVKGGWGRFVHMRENIPELTDTNRNNATTTTWRWRDLNGNRDYDAGEVDLNPNGADFQGITGTTDAVPNPNEKQPKTDEFSLTLERELTADWGVRVTGLYVRKSNQHRLQEIYRPYDAYNIPITNPDPGPDGVLRTADDPGTMITYYDYPANLAGRQFAGTMLINDDRAESNYKTIEVAGTKRLSRGWQVMAAYTATKSDVPFSRAAYDPQAPNNPNGEIFTANHTWDWLAKISGAYTFPFGIIGSANFYHQSGDPQARQARFTGGRQIQALVVNVEPLGSIRLPNVNLLDLRAAKRINLGGGRALEVRADVFNAANVNTTTSRVLRSGPDYLRVQAIVPPRVVQFGATFTF